MQGQEGGGKRKKTHVILFLSVLASLNEMVLHLILPPGSLWSKAGSPGT